MKRVMYLGERVNVFKIGQLFRDKRGKDYWYRGVKGVWFGSIYEIDDKESIKIRPAEVDAAGWEPSEKDRAEWEAQKAVVKAFRLEKRKAMQLKRPHADIVKAIQLLAPFWRSLDRFDQERFSKYLANELQREANSAFKTFKPGKRRR